MGDTYKVEYYKTKKITFGPIEYVIVTQNSNGPCPLLALINVLVLKGKIQLDTTEPQIGNEELVQILSNVLLIPPSDEKELEIYEANLQDVLPIISNLHKGLDVNVKFSNISDFEFTSAQSLFDLLKVNLYHVWLPDPQLGPIYEAVKNITYNELVVRIFDENDKEYQFLKDFHDDTKSQITFHGLMKLCEKMKDGEIAVLFRNNHFHTILKRRDEIFTLVTDEGFFDEKNIVWESLSSVDGDSFFVDPQFHTYKEVVVAQEPVRSSQSSPIPSQSSVPPPEYVEQSARSRSIQVSPTHSSQKSDKSKCLIM
ncbi:unnamed protein product [Caenorhabditis angaria]|uniref:Ubiquitin carboxyl-terminal hydrolase n=1 Tax=Caenorhabditis angaria TaxID=860376 RepID=A0A9P1IPQ4_9PELO|nr:unnamed protein product [Caenorhabditis angaria]